MFVMFLLTLFEFESGLCGNSEGLVSVHLQSLSMGCQVRDGDGVTFFISSLDHA